MLVILRILFTVQPPVVARWGPDPRKPGSTLDGMVTISTLNRLSVTYSYKEAKDKKRQKFGWL
jgi:hypothetical protein